MGELLDFADSALEHCRPGEDIEAYVVHRTVTTVQVGAGAVIRHVGRAETRGVGVQVISRTRAGYASTADISTAAIAAAVSAARDNAAAADRDEAAVLPRQQPSTVSGGFWSPTIGGIPLLAKIEIAQQLARRVTKLDPRIRSLDTAEYRDEDVTVAVASTRGMRANHRRAYVEAYVDALGEGPYGTAGGYSYWLGRDVTSIDVETLTRDAVDRTTPLLSRPVPAPATGPVVLGGSVVASLLVAIGRACSGGPLSSGRSTFTDQRGKVVGSPIVTLTDDGLSLLAPDGADLDDEGVPKQQTPLISEGILVGALHSTASAAALGGAQSTGNARRATHKSLPRAAPTALTLRPNCSLPELLERAGDAVYLQQLSGGQSGISSITGRVNVGGVGWLLRAGYPAGRLPTSPVATSLTAFLSAIEAVADDTQLAPGQPVLAPTVLCSPDWLH